MLFATASLARRIEEAERALIVDMARSVGERRPDVPVYIEPIGGGAAVYGGPGSPMNKIVGLGFEALDAATLDRVEREFSCRQAPVQAEVSALANPSVCEHLTRRGYVLRGFENVLAVSPTDFLQAGCSAAIAVTHAPQGSPHWIEIVAAGFLRPDAFDGPVSHETFSRETLEQVFEDTSSVPGFQRYFAHRSDAVAGGASMRMWNGVAQLCGASTLPEHRRQGVQSALLQFRLAEAARCGCDIAIVTTQPGSKSQENVQRQGFTLLYARAVLVKEV